MNGHNADEIYIEESYELLSVIENSIVILENEPDNKEVINTIFRALHTIKGSGSMFGFNDIAAFTHQLETIFDQMRKSGQQITSDIIDLTFAAIDYIRALLAPDSLKENNDLKEFKETKVQVGQLIEEYIKNGLISGSSIPGKIPQSFSDSPNKQSNSRVYRISFVPCPGIFIKGVRVENLFRELGELGEVFNFAHTDKYPELKKADPESCFTRWTILLISTCEINAIKDIFIFVEDSADISIDIIDDENHFEGEIDYKKIGEILLERGELTQTEVDNIIQHKELFGDIALKKGVLKPEVLDSALSEQKIVRKVRIERKKQVESSTIRVKNEKLDELVNLVGEMVTLEARLDQYVSDKNDTELTSIVERLDRLISELRDNTMNLRMIPLANTFNSFYRLVRDLGRDLDKKINLSLSGIDTQLDKNVIESLKDPLVHIIRNSAGHGIELPADRIKSGKPAEGTITLEAEYSGANVLIRITDDGKGLDPERIRQIAIQKGLIAETKNLTNEEIYALIFKPGFSTSEKTDSISGRGVGMDVVKKNIEKLRGFVQVESELDKGTVITLKIPLTLAIIDGLLVSIADNYYVINLSAVEECIDIKDQEISKNNNRKIINLRGAVLPYIDLREYLDIDSKAPAIEQLVIVSANNKKIGLKVDNVIGKYQTVIKSVSRMYKNIEEVSGATILGNGTIALILDVIKIIEKYEKNNSINSR